MGANFNHTDSLTRTIFRLCLSRAVFFLLSGFILFFLILIYAKKTLDLHIFSDFFSFIGHFFTGNWGISSLFKQNISSFIWLYFTSSTSLGSFCLVSAFFFGLVLSFYALRFPPFAKWVQIILLGTPITVWAVCLNFAFGSNHTTQGLKENFGIQDFILPWMVITLYHSSAILQMNHFFFQTESQKEYYKILCRGPISQGKLFKKYLVKPHLSSIIHNLSLKVCILLGGSVGVENFFHLPGLGFLLRKSIIEKDLNLLFTASFLTLLFITLAYLILDIIRVILVQKEGQK